MKSDKISLFFEFPVALFGRQPPLTRGPWISTIRAQASRTLAKPKFVKGRGTAARRGGGIQKNNKVRSNLILSGGSKPPPYTESDRTTKNHPGGYRRGDHFSITLQPELRSEARYFRGGRRGDDCVCRRGRVRDGFHQEIRQRGGCCQRRPNWW